MVPPPRVGGGAPPTVFAREEPPLPEPPPAVPAPPAPGGAEIEEFLCATIAQLAPHEPVPGARGPGRPRGRPALYLWAGLLVCVLRGFGSHLALWRLLTGGGFWRFPRVASSDQALYHRLARDGTAPLCPAQVRATFCHRRMRNSHPGRTLCFGGADGPIWTRPYSYSDTSRCLRSIARR